MGGVQLDMLYDVDGAGRYGVKSTGLLSDTPRAQRISDDPVVDVPVVSESSSLVYLWRKRSVKKQWDRLPELRRRAQELDETNLIVASVAITGNDRAGQQLLGLQDPYLQSRFRHPSKRIARFASRIRDPVGFWAHSASPSIGTDLARRFGRFLVVSDRYNTPAPIVQPLWWARRVIPVRLRAGVLISTGSPPLWPRPDCYLTDHSPDEAARELVSAMGTHVERA